MSLTGAVLACLLLTPGEAPPALLKGKVIDSLDQAGIPGAHVALHGAKDAETVTGPDGSFQLELPPYGDYDLSAGKAGYRAEFEEVIVPIHFAENAPAPAPVVLVLHRPGMIRGTVVGEVDGRPLTDFHVEAFRCVYQRGHREPIPEMWFSSSKPKFGTGTFELPGLPPGEYVLEIKYGAGSKRIRWPAGDLDYLPGLRLGSGADLDVAKIKVPSNPQSTVSIEVIAPECEPGRQYKIEINETSSRMSRLWASATAACPRPRARLEVPPGVYQVVATEADRKNPAAGATTLEMTGKEDRATVTAQRQTPIQGQVLTAETAGEEALRELYKKLKVRLWTGTPGGGSEISVLPNLDPARVNSDGTFQTAAYPVMEGGRTLVETWGLPAGYFVKDVVYDGTACAGRRFSPGAHGQEHKLQITISGRSGTFQGAVRDSGGDPVSHAKVLLVPWPAELEAGYPADLIETQTDTKGAFSFRGLNPLTYKALAVRSTARPRLEEPGRLVAVLSDAKSIDVQPASSSSIELMLSEQ